MDGGELRASDQERETTAQLLREHFAAGRLSQEEFDERVQAAYAARTDAQLRGLLRDLPTLPVTQAQRRADLVERRRHLQGRLLQQTGGSLGAFVVCVFVWLASGAHGQFWPMWVALVAVIPLLRGAWRLYGPAPELDRLERELDERSRARHERREERRNERAVARGGRRR